MTSDRFYELIDIKFTTVDLFQALKPPSALEII